MARNLSSRTKRSRRIGEKLIAHGEKAFSRRPYPPGQHGPKGSGKSSEYGIRLREKQKAQLVYGVLERQFRRYVTEAKRKIGDTGEFLLQLLELRLDNVVFRAGFSPSREASRQLIRHRHVVVNNKRVDIPSYHVTVGSRISIREHSQHLKGLEDLAKTIENHQPPTWISLNKQRVEAHITSMPRVEESVANINPQRIVEFYSR